ncbi:hypothetical protein [Cellulomonas triticagri]|uniref:Uncharacterized protein n=1 Tax=Cellulomonas triticagri TaxID=2483352 RepID=A0A3M2JTE7_9CELL|nr:hypothetical protein [Cellulomonas triticagri]RMI14025.1 hypothetical protein EBM89_02095 [Cellulomonas triticagri]
MTTTTTPQTQDSRKKKIWTVVGVGALAAAIAGAGAVSILNTTIGDNRFKAEVPTEGEGVTRGVHLAIAGQEFDETFDAITANRQYQREWVLTNSGPDTGTFDGEFTNFSQLDAALGDALTIEYQVTGDGIDTGFVPAGTLASGASFADATGISTIDGNETLTITVRVTLVDPTVLGTTPEGDDPVTLNVAGDFVVSYTNPFGV